MIHYFQKNIKSLSRKDFLGILGIIAGTGGIALALFSLGFLMGMQAQRGDITILYPEGVETTYPDREVVLTSPLLESIYE
jgi:hypothetical protein